MTTHNNRLGPTASQLRRQEQELAAEILRGGDAGPGRKAPGRPGTFDPEPSYDPAKHGSAGLGVGRGEPDIPSKLDGAAILGVDFELGVVETSFGDFPLQPKELQQVAFVCVRALDRSLNEFVGVVSERHGVDKLLNEAAELIRGGQAGKVEVPGPTPPTRPASLPAAEQHPGMPLVDLDEEAEAAGRADARASVPGVAPARVRRSRRAQ